LKPIWTGTPFDKIASAQRFTLSRLRSIGFSQSRLASGDRLFDIVGMRVSHRRDKDRIDIRRGKDLGGRP
jgi:hypothetical protein